MAKSLDFTRSEFFTLAQLVEYRGMRKRQGEWENEAEDGEGGRGGGGEGGGEEGGISRKQRGEREGFLILFFYVFV